MAAPVPDDLTAQNSWEIAAQWQQILLVLKRRKQLLINFILVTFLVVAVGTELQPRIYRATARVLIDTESQHLMALRVGDAALSANEYLAYDSYYRTQLQLVASSSVAQVVYEKLGLAHNPHYAKSKGSIESLRRHIKVEPVRDTRIAMVHADDRDPVMAQRLANEFAAVYVAENLIRTMTSETSSLVKNERIRLQAELAENVKRYKEKHPKMIRLRDELEHLDVAMEQEIINEIKREASKSSARSEHGKASVASAESLSIEQWFEGAMQPNNIRVQDLAELPHKPFRPRRSLNWGLALLCGLLGGITSVAALELVDNTIKTADEVEREVDVPLLGSIPTMDGMNGALGRTVELDTFQRYRYVQQLPHSDVAEAYRVLRTGLQFTAPTTGGSNALIITSPGMQEGKSTTVINLGVTLALGGIKTLVVDADLRRSKFHHIFHIHPAPGLSEFLVGAATLDDIVHPTDIPNLFVVTSGVRPPNPAELLGSDRLRDFLSRTQTRFDRVLIDTPPMLAVTDPAIMAAAVKRVVLVVKSGRTPRPALRRVQVMCREIGAKIVGTIMNGVLRREEAYYASYAKYYTSGTYTKPGYTKAGYTKPGYIKAGHTQTR